MNLILNKGAQFLSAETLELNAVGKEIVFEFVEDVSCARYHQNQCDVNAFTARCNELICLFHSLLPDFFEIDIIPYERVTHCLVYQNIKKITCGKAPVNKRGISRYGIRTTDEKFVEEIFLAALKYEAFPIIISQDDNVAFTPTDHLDLFVSGTEESIGNVKALYNNNDWACRTFTCRDI